MWWLEQRLEVQVGIFRDLLVVLISFGIVTTTLVRFLYLVDVFISIFFFFWNERLRRLTRLWFLGKMMMIRTMEQCSTRVCSLLMVFNFYYSHWWQDFKFRLLGFFGIDKTPRWCKSLNTSDCRDLLQRQQNWWDESLCLSRLSLTHTHTQERQSNLSKWRL